MRKTLAQPNPDHSQDISNVDDDPLGGLLFKVSPHLERLAKKSPAVHKQFYPSSEELCATNLSFLDPLLEDEFVKTPGLVHKYPGRVLLTMTMTCAAYCRFCTRRRMVSDIDKGTLTMEDVDNMVTYLQSHPDITEVIFSGGDPLTVPRLLIAAITKIKKLPNIKIIRIHTRVPVSNPTLITPQVLRAFKSVTKQPLYVSVHFEHPDELTPATKKAVRAIRQTGAIMLSQSVFLRGINDHVDVLAQLFTQLIQLGIRPYYIYHCDPTRGVEHFMVPFAKEVDIMTQLRKQLSGLACPTYVIDTPNGSGKIPVPLDFWEFNKQGHKDFLDEYHEVIGPQ
jgi:lysine 2,3-aminomutase